MNVVFCDKRDCLFLDIDGICNCAMPDGVPYCKSEGIDAKRDAADGLREENARLRKYVKWLEELALRDPNYYRELKFEFKMKRRELGIEVSE